MDHGCEACGTREYKVLYPVLEELAEGEQKQIYVCENCVPRFEKVKYFIQQLDGPLFSIENRPMLWKNDAPLHYTHNHIVYYMLEIELSDLDEHQRAQYLQERAFDPARVPLDDFPLVEDFEVSLEGSIAKHEINKKRISCFLARLYSPSLGYLGSFSGHDQSNYLCRSDFVIPHGDFMRPYYDLEQGIDLLITEDEQFVYIFFGDWEQHNAHHEPGVWHRIENYYDTWVKVRRERYYEQWNIAIERSRAYHGTDASKNE